MWILTPFGKTRLPLVGVKWGDLTDEEYAAAVARHPGMEEQGYFDKVEEPEEKPRRNAPSATPPAEEK